MITDNNFAKSTKSRLKETIDWIKRYKHCIDFELALLGFDIYINFAIHLSDDYSPFRILAGIRKDIYKYSIGFRINF